MSNVEKLLDLARKLSSETADFNSTKGPGVGNKATTSFIRELRQRALDLFGEDYAERNVAPMIGSSFDYYFPEEQTVIEIAFGLSKPLSEFERDILKAVLGKKHGKKINKLIFLSKAGGLKKSDQPFRREVIKHSKEGFGIEIEIRDF